MKMKLVVIALLVVAGSLSVAAPFTDNAQTFALWHMDEIVPSGATRMVVGDDNSVTGRTAQNLILGKNTDNVVNHPSLVDSMVGYGKALLFDSTSEQTTLNLGAWQGSNTTVVKFMANQSSQTSLTQSVINTNAVFDIRMGSGTLTAYIWLAEGGLASLTRSYIQGEWTDVELVVTEDQMFLTVNGSTASKSISGLNEVAGVTRVGSSATYSRYFDGMVDEMKIGVVPEPATLALMGLGCLGLRLRRKTGNKQKA